MSGDARWPPVYDFEDLSAQIKDIIDRDALEKEFYELGSDSDLKFLQGDVLEFRTRLPFLDETGAPAAQQWVREWLFLGNTCAASRPDVEFAQLVPIFCIGRRDELGKEEVGEYRRYKNFNFFYLPPWSSELFEDVRVADFRQPVTIRSAGLKQVSMGARLQRPSWVLLNACLVRFFARDDGRMDP